MSDSLNRLRGQRVTDNTFEETPFLGNSSMESLGTDDNPLLNVGFGNSISVGAGDHIRTALESLTPSEPVFVEREEFDEHVKEDMREHDELRSELRELKSMAGVINEAEILADAVSVTGSEQRAARVVAQEAFKQMARELKVAPPEPSMEGLEGWVTKLKTFVRVAAANYSNAAKTGVIRPIKSLATVNSNLQRVRRDLDKLEYREGLVIHLDNRTAAALAVGNRVGGVPEISSNIAKLVMQVIEVHLVGTDNYLMSADALRRALAEMESLPETDEGFEAILKKAAGMVHSSEVYYEIEPGTTVYPGNVQFKKVDFDPARNYPTWFEPIIRMDSAPFFELQRNRTMVGAQTIELSTTELSQLLDTVEEAIKHLYDADKKWSDKVVEMHNACKDTIAKAEKWPAEDMAQYSVINKRMLDIAMKNLLLLPVVLSQPTTVMINPLIDSLFAVVDLAAMTVKKAQ